MQTITTGKKKKESVSRILRAAARVFSKKGFSGARMDEIARRAGVNKATIYYHIGDKTALYEAVLMGVLGSTADKVVENVGREETTERKLRVFVVTLARNIGMNRDYPPMMMREIADGGSRLPDEVIAQMTRVIETLRLILEEGQRKGYFRPVNTIVTHFMIVGSIMFYMAGEQIRKKINLQEGESRQLDIIQSIEEVAERVADMVINSMRRRY
jgi:AcrR family transcriptional regulator